eukprot:4710589-Alexandrium_andersonii.AAC.1
MDEAVVPAGPTGRNVPVQGFESAESRGPEVSALRAEGSALRAAPPAQRAATAGVPMFRRFQALDKEVSPCGACWDRSLIH